MMEEIFSELGRTAEDGALSETLFYDIVRCSRLAAAISSVDAANCYDSIAHAIASLVFQACGMPVEGIEAMLSAIQDMKYFLRTAFIKVCVKEMVRLRLDGRQLVSQSWVHTRGKVTVRSSCARYQIRW